MKDSKLIEILKTFTAAEFRDLEKFILSPYFRKRDVSGLFEILKPFFPSFENEKLNYKYIYEKLYPGKNFDEKKSDSLLRTLSSDLYILCREFLIQIEMNAQKTFRNYFLLNQLRKRKLYGEFKKIYAESINESLDNKKELAIGFIEKSILQNAVIEFHNDRTEFEETFENILSQIENLIAAATLKALRFADQKLVAWDGYNLKIRYNLADTFSRHLDIKGMLEEMKRNSDIFTPYIEIYYYLNQLILEPSDEKNFYILKDLLISGGQDLPKSEMYMIFSVLVSYSREKSQDGNNDFRREVFELYNSMLHLGVYKYSSEDHIAPGMIRNMLTQARLCREFEWMKQLIDKYLIELHPDFRQSMTSYALGQYHFSIGENEKALENLITLRSEYFLFKKDLKDILFRIYYTLGYYEEAFSVLDSMKKYINSTKDLSESIKTNSRNFIKFASELLTIKTGSKNSNPGFLYEKIKKEKYTESCNWLMEKVSELK